VSRREMEPRDVTDLAWEIRDVDGDCLLVYPTERGTAIGACETGREERGFAAVLTKNQLGTLIAKLSQIAGAPVLTPEASRILDAARALPVALEGSEAVDPWMGLAHVVSAVRAEAAAVGAPVLAPAEDGRPSLAEWVAACEGSALGQPAWSVLDSRFTDQPLQATWPQVWLRIDVEDEPTVWAGPPVQRFFTTPAELRALLDALARPA